MMRAFCAKADVNNQEAITMIGTNIEVDKEQIAALFQAGYRAFEQGRYEEARKILTGVLVLDGANPFVYEILGTIYSREERPEVALACFNKAIELVPTEAFYLVNRAEILLKLGRVEQAAQDLKSAIQLDRDMKDPAANRARLLVLAVQDAIRTTAEKKSQIH
jgi:tetratricopeptide (TPR) repeat protein